MPDGRSKLILKDETTGEFVDVVSYASASHRSRLGMHRVTPS